MHSSRRRTATGGASRSGNIGSINGSRLSTICAPISEDLVMLDESIMLSPIGNIREVEATDGRESFAGLDSWALSSKALESRFELAGNLKKRSVAAMAFGSTTHDEGGTDPAAKPAGPIAGGGRPLNARGNAFGWTGKGVASGNGANPGGALVGDGGNSNTSYLSNEAAGRPSHIKTVVRVRPLEHDHDAGDGQLSLTVLDDARVQTTAPPEVPVSVPRKQYRVSRVLDAATTQEQTFDETAKPLLASLVDPSGGRSGLVVAHGATNAGKTHTIVGGDSGSNDAGILPRTLAAAYEMAASPPPPPSSTSSKQDLQSSSEDSSASSKTAGHNDADALGAAATAEELVSEQNDGVDAPSVPKFAVHMRVVEVYNNQAYDLLTDAPDVRAQPALVVKRLPDGRDEIKGLSNHVPADLSAAMHLVHRAKNRAESAATALNATSSRGHTIWMIELQENNGGAAQDGEGGEAGYVGQNCASRRVPKSRANTPRLWIVDMAGSERSERANSNTGEASHINQDHSTLFLCLKQTSSNRRCVSFRTRLLTRIVMGMLAAAVAEETMAAAGDASTGGASHDGAMLSSCQSSAATTSACAPTAVPSSTSTCVMIVNVNPAPSEYSETQKVLDNAMLAMNAKPKAEKTSSRTVYSSVGSYDLNGHLIGGGAVKRQKTSATISVSGPDTPSVRSRPSGLTLSSRPYFKNGPLEVRAVPQSASGLQDVAGAPRAGGVVTAASSSRGRNRGALARAPGQEQAQAQAQMIVELQAEVERLTDLLQDAGDREAEIEEQTRKEVQERLLADIDQLEARVETLQAQNVQAQQRLNDKRIEEESHKTFADKKQEAEAAEKQRKLEAAAVDKQTKTKAFYANLENKLAAYEEAEEQVTRLTEELEREQAGREEDAASAARACREAEAAAKQAAQGNRDAIERAAAAENALREIKEELAESERRRQEQQLEAMTAETDANTSRVAAAEVSSERVLTLEKALEKSEKERQRLVQEVAQKERERVEALEESERARLPKPSANTAPSDRKSPSGCHCAAIGAFSPPRAFASPEGFSEEYGNGDYLVSTIAQSPVDTTAMDTGTGDKRFARAFVSADSNSADGQGDARCVADKQNLNHAEEGRGCEGDGLGKDTDGSSTKPDSEKACVQKERALESREGLLELGDDESAHGNSSSLSIGSPSAQSKKHGRNTAQRSWEGEGQDASVSAQRAELETKPALADLKVENNESHAENGGFERVKKGKTLRRLAGGRTRRRPLMEVASTAAAGGVGVQAGFQNEKGFATRWADEEETKREEIRRINAAAEKERKRRLVGATTPKKPLSKVEAAKVQAGEKALLRRSTRNRRLR